MLSHKDGQFKNLLDVPIHRMLDDLSESVAAKLANECDFLLALLYKC